MKTTKHALLVALVLCVAGSAASAWPTDRTFGPYLQNPTSTSMVVCWVTATAGPSTVTYGASPALGSTVTSAAPVKEHQVALTGLTPATTYYYSVSGAGFTGSGTFKTAVLGATPFSFVAMGETHTEDAVGGFAEEVLAASPQLIVDASDQVDSGSSRDEWDRYFTIGGAFYPHVPVLNAVGNHTYLFSNGYPLPGSMGTAEFKRIMNNPGNEEWYSVRSGNTQFIALNSTWYFENPSRIFKQQKDWLKSTLAAATDGVDDPTYKVVFMHIPTWSSGPLYREALERLAMRKYFMPLFETYHVNLVIAAHDKLNEHSLKSGVHYAQIATGELGHPVETPNPNSLFVEPAKRAILVVDVAGGAMTCKFVSSEGLVLHSWSIPASAP
ncbi:MAG: metallophosphoesterase family protein [Planctomycetes bacterium]|nr:metallophosphoesterase family protein [Planctomycetota bacterium]